MSRCLRRRKKVSLVCWHTSESSNRHPCSEFLDTIFFIITFTFKRTESSSGFPQQKKCALKQIGGWPPPVSLPLYIGHYIPAAAGHIFLGGVYLKTQLVTVHVCLCRDCKVGGTCGMITNNSKQLWGGLTIFHTESFLRSDRLCNQGKNIVVICYSIKERRCAAGNMCCVLADVQCRGVCAS